jgi:predicted nucleic-acid-binding protein
MRAVDTNVLIRLIAQDELNQAAAAERFIQQGAWVSVLALAETAWVLAEVYDRSPAELAAAIEVLLSHRSLVLQDSEAVAAALEQFRKRPALGFSDCLVLEIARKAGHLPFGTFDRALGNVDGAQRL